MFLDETKAFFSIFGGVLRTAAKNRKKCVTKRCSNHIQKDFLINVWGYLKSGDAGGFLGKSLPSIWYLISLRSFFFALRSFFFSAFSEFFQKIRTSLPECFEKIRESQKKIRMALRKIRRARGGWQGEGWNKRRSNKWTKFQRRSSEWHLFWHCHSHNDCHSRGGPVTGSVTGPPFSSGTRWWCWWWRVIN